MHKQKNKDIPFMLDKKHSDFIDQFNKDTKIIIPKLQQEITTLEQKK